MSRRRGFTLVELLIALVVIDVALLAFAADGALLVRLRGVAERREAALLAATSRVARIRIAGCAAAASGAGTPSTGVRESWTVSRADSAELHVRDSVAYGTDATPAAVLLDAAVGC